MRNRYVYLHLAVKPRDKGQVFYVGIGTHYKGNKYQRMMSNDKRNDIWKKVVRKYGVDRVGIVTGKHLPFISRLYS